MGYFNSPCKMYHLILTPKKRHSAWDGPFVLSPVFNSSLLDITYDRKTRQNATLTDQERQGGVQLKVCWLCFVICWFLDYFSSWEFRRLVPWFCPCWHTLRLGSLCTHYVWAACEDSRIGSLISRKLKSAVINSNSLTFQMISPEV